MPARVVSLTLIAPAIRLSNADQTRYGVDHLHLGHPKSPPGGRRVQQYIFSKQASELVISSTVRILRRAWWQWRFREEVPAAVRKDSMDSKQSSLLVNLDQMRKIGRAHLTISASWPDCEVCQLNLPAARGTCVSDAPRLKHLRNTVRRPENRNRTSFSGGSDSDRYLQPETALVSSPPHIP